LCLLHVMCAAVRRPIAVKRAKKRRNFYLTFPNARAASVWCRSERVHLLRRVQSDVTELNWTELTWFSFWRTDQWASSSQVVMHYSKHGLTMSVARMRQPMTNGLVLLAHWSVPQKLNRVTLVQFSYVALYAPLRENSRITHSGEMGKWIPMETNIDNVT